MKAPRAAAPAGPAAKKDRADRVLVARGLAESREKAQALIMSGLVSTAGRRIDKPGWPIDPAAEIEIVRPLPYVGRGGLKLAGALDALSLDPRGRVCADIGASTGGFTDVLLQRGAARVFAVDVNVRQIDPRLRADPRVILVEKNARYLAPADLEAAGRARGPAAGGGGAAGPLPDFVVMDVSFISILKILPALREILIAAGAAASPGPPLLLALVKPQFEAGRAQAGKGVVRDPAVHAEVLRRVVAGAGETGFRLLGLVRSPAPGQRGNREFFALFGLAEPGGDVAAQAIDVLESIREVTGHVSGRVAND